MTSAKGDSTYQAKRYAAFSNPLNLREGAILNVKAYLDLIGA